MRKLPLKTKDLAWRCIKNFRRYRHNLHTGKSTWDQDGPFTPNQLVPMCTRAQHAEAERVMRREGYQWFGTRIEWVDPRRVKSFQRHLRVKSLLWNLRHFEEMQVRFTLRRNATTEEVDAAAQMLPKVIRLTDGTLVVWNGNHRTTIALLTGRTRMLAQVFKAGKTSAKAARKRPKKRRAAGIPLAALFEVGCK